MYSCLNFDPGFDRPASSIQKTTDIILENQENSLGFTLRGGSYGPDPRKSRPITVTNVRAGGAADREGRLRVGDIILAIDGIDVSSATLRSASRLLQSPRRAITLTVEYDVSVHGWFTFILSVFCPHSLSLGAYRAAIERIIPH